jgi:hypothetical protein
MSLLGKVLHTLRVWTGLADATESRLTPDHGWLLATPDEARRQRDVSTASRAAHVRERRARG